MFKTELERYQLGVNVNSVLINTIIYADDTVILFDNLDELQFLLNSVSTVSEQMGLSEQDKIHITHKMFNRKYYHSLIAMKK